MVTDNLTEHTKKINELEEKPTRVTKINEIYEFLGVQRQFIPEHGKLIPKGETKHG